DGHREHAVLLRNARPQRGKAGERRAVFSSGGSPRESLLRAACSTPSRRPFPGRGTTEQGARGLSRVGRSGGGRRGRISRRGTRRTSRGLLATGTERTRGRKTGPSVPSGFATRRRRASGTPGTTGDRPGS